MLMDGWKTLTCHAFAWKELSKTGKTCFENTRWYIFQIIKEHLKLTSSFGSYCKSQLDVKNNGIVCQFGTEITLDSL